jgi:hypothetical protein
MLVLLESKGYLARAQGLSRGMTVAAPDATRHGELKEQDVFILSVILGWLSRARDKELQMAAQVTEHEIKSALIEAARRRHEQVMMLESSLGPAFKVWSDYAVNSPAVNASFPEVLECSAWETFVVDELICNRVSGLISQYAAETPALNGLLRRNNKLTARMSTMAELWAREALTNISSDGAQEHLRRRAAEISAVLYATAKELDRCYGSGEPLLAAALDGNEGIGVLEPF